MPFTFSHPALVLPLSYLPRKWVSVTGLVIGSIMPDFEAYLRLNADKEHSHTPGGILWFCLPVGLALAFVYHNFVRDTLINHAPPFLQRRLVRYTCWSWNKSFKQNWWIVLVSLLAGVASHFLWDTFSHFDGWLVKLNPALSGNTSIWGYNIEIPYLIQYINSLVGMIVIIAAIICLPVSKTARVNVDVWPYWLMVLFVTIFVFGAKLLLTGKLTTDDMIIAATSSFFIGIIAASVAFAKKPATLPSNKKGASTKAYTQKNF